jgi:tetraacyldisaccharide 4'-kinase
MVGADMKGSSRYHRGPPQWLVPVLLPLSWLYGIIIRLRNAAFDREMLATYRSPLPVISIGNITVGGTGKTPMTLWVASQLSAQGWHPVILSRGYGGSLVGPHLVAATDAATLVGDEPLLLASRRVCPVVVCRKRVTGARFIEDLQLGDLIILDDGHQHRWLERCVNVVLVGCGDEGAAHAFERGTLLPAGMLREPRTQGLRRADIVILSQRGGDPSLVPSIRAVLARELPEAIPVFSATVTAQPPSNREGVVLSSQTPVWLLSAIAGPEVLEHSMSRLGYRVVGRTYLPDHAPLSSALVAEVWREASLCGAKVVCTEKDWVKIPLDTPQDLYCLRVDSRVEEASEFIREIRRKMERDLV